jgi:hypothetical protein
MWYILNFNATNIEVYFCLHSCNYQLQECFYLPLQGAKEVNRMRLWQYISIFSYVGIIIATAIAIITFISFSIAPIVLFFLLKDQYFYR